MNERINELAKQAGAEIFGPKGYTNILVNGWDATPLMRKFAELIVKECVEVALNERVAQKDIDDEYDEEIRQYLCGNNSGIDDAVIAIRKHFGVE